MARQDQRTREDSLAAEMLGHRGQLVRLAQGVLADGHLAEDAVASAYLRAWRARRQLRQRQKLLPWLRTICRHEALRIARQSQQWRCIGPDGMGQLLVTAAPHDADRLAAEELLSRLPSTLRQCARLHFLAGQTHRQIAAALSLKATTVRGRLRMARERLREEQTMRTSGDMKATKRRIKNGTLAWEGLKIRFLGTCRTGGEALYNAAGKRLSRLPVAIQRAGAMPPSAGKRPFGADPWKGPLVWAFWELSGPAEARRDLQMTTQVLDSDTGRECLPSGGRDPMPAGVKVVWTFYFGLPEGTRAVRLESELLGGEDRSSELAWRWDFGFDRGLDSWIIGGRPDRGAICATPPRPEREKTHCRLSVVHSSVEDVAPRVFGLNRAREEVAPVQQMSCHKVIPGGHFRMEDVELPIPPEELFGLALYPRRRASLDWGRVVVPQ